MKLCIITPTDGLKRFAILSDNIHLVLAHLIGDNEYTLFYRKRREMGDYIIMDNGAYEFKKPLPTDELIMKAELVNANCLVAPDYPYVCYEQTIKSTEDFIKELKKYNLLDKFHVMAVPQSEENDFDGWLTSYKYFGQNKDIYMIGMSILAIPNACKQRVGTEEIETNRVYVTKYLKENNLVVDKKHHYLGAGTYLQYIQLYDIAYSLDTSSPVWHGMHHIRYDYMNGLQEKLKSAVDFDARIEKDVEADIYYNIACLQRWSKGVNKK